MKKKGIIALLLALVMVLSLSACSPKGETRNLTDAPLAGAMIADFANGAPSTMFSSDGWCNGNPFNVCWKASEVSFSDGEMHLGISKPDKAGDGWEYYGGEERSSIWYGYGDFEVRMKPAKVAGTASTFFTCTGPYDIGLGGVPNQHDEIDIEFLGKDTTGVQFNYFVYGEGGHEYWYDLGFDASEEYHDYGFRWTENDITWFVDSKPVYKVTRQNGEAWPSHPGRILCNYWCGTIEALTWMGAYSDNAATADYKWIKTSAEGVDINPAPADSGNNNDAGNAPAAENSDVDWSAIPALELSFTSTNGKHEITADGTSYAVTYADMVCDWSNITASVAGMASGSNAMHLKLRNDDASSDHVVRIDLLKDGKCLNTSATMDGSAVYTDLEWGGSFFETLAAGAEGEIVIYFNGEPDSLVIMLDSTHQGDDNAYSGAYTISDVKFSGSGAAPSESSENNVPAENTEPAQPAEPVGDVTVAVSGKTANVSGNMGAGEYSVSSENDALRVTYSGIAGNSYKNLYIDGADLVSGNLFTAKIANNGSEPVNIRVDVLGDKQGNADATNTAATQNGEPVFTDIEWGGSTFVVQPGETADIAVQFDTARNPRALIIFFDSSIYDNTDSHSSDVTVSDMTFTEGELAIPETTAPAAVNTSASASSQTSDPAGAVGPDGIKINGQTVSFSGSTGAGEYAVKLNRSSDSLSVTYKDLPGGTYKNLGSVTNSMG